MPYRYMQLAVHRDIADDAAAALEEIHPRDWWRAPPADGGEVEFVHLLIHTARSQEVMDALADALGESDLEWRLTVVATDAVLPEPDDEEEQEDLERRDKAAAREEIFTHVRDGTLLSRDYLILSALAAFVAGIGLHREQVAVVIGAMVIAPLLGPILAFSFGTALGNRNLLFSAASALGAGLAVATVVGVALGLAMEVNTGSRLLQFDAPLGVTTAALPLAAGGAAALMLASAQTGQLIGVAVAAALLPPLAGFGLLLGAGEPVLAVRALVTVFANVVAITLAAQVVFLWKGIRPKTFLSDQKENSVRWMVGIWAVLALVMTAALIVFGDMLQAGG